MSEPFSQKPIKKAYELPCELIVALDTATASNAQTLIRELAGLPVIYKVGFELFINSGPEWVKKLKSQEHRIFLDLKLHDIPNTVSKAVSQIKELNVDLFTLHLSGGTEMIQAAVAALGTCSTRALGVSVLTSMSESMWNRTLSALADQTVQTPVSDSVMSLVRMGKAAGLRGFVCSPQELQLLKKQFSDAYFVTPGIRPTERAPQKDDQARTMTPKEAAQAGASAIVVGRPITQATDPRAAAEAILSELKA